MYEKDIPGGCHAAIALIERDGWVGVGTGWVNKHGEGWCLEGALAQAVGIPMRADNSGRLDLDQQARFYAHPVMRAVAHHLLTKYRWADTMYSWNDTSSRDRVIVMLREVATLHTMAPSMDRTAALMARVKEVAAGLVASFTKLGEPKQTLTVEFAVIPEEPDPPVEVPDSVPEEWTEDVMSSA